MNEKVKQEHSLTNIDVMERMITAVFRSIFGFYARSLFNPLSANPTKCVGA